MTTYNHLPNFIVIGPGKSGTSWLYQVLEHHPQVCVSSAKETLYFEDYYHKGLQWYARFFRDCGKSDLNHAIGEISNTYIFSAEAARRIAADFPTMRVIATLRDPVERAFSHYLFLRRNGVLTCDFETALLKRPDLQTRGNYFQHLLAYREHFPPEQLGVFIYDDLLQSPADYARQLFDFLDIGPLPDPSIFNVRVLEASQARSRLLARLVVRSANLVRKAGFPDIVTRVKTGWLPKLFFRPLKRSERPTLDHRLRIMLEEYYHADVKELSQWLGRDLVSAWRKSESRVYDSTTSMHATVES